MWKWKGFAQTPSLLPPVHPFIIFSYTNRCKSLGGVGSHILQFCRKNTVSVSLLSSGDADNNAALSEFTDWCKASFLEMNACKTKEMVIDFGKSPSAISSLFIENQHGDIVHQFQYLGIVKDGIQLAKKAHQWMYCLHRLQGQSFDGKCFISLNLF